MELNRKKTSKMEKTKTEIIQERFGARIDDWKRQYRDVFGYVSEDGKCCVLRTPDLTILDACRTMSRGSSIRFDMALLENCWLDGDPELKTEDKYRMGIFDWLGSIIKKTEGELVEL